MIIQLRTNYKIKQDLAHHNIIIVQYNRKP